MKIFDKQQTIAAMPYDALIEAIWQMFKQGCVVPRRHIHSIDSDDAGSTLLIMPAWQKNHYLGIKQVTIYPENSKKFGIAGLFSTYTLFDAKNGMPVAVIDGDAITCRRTVAASALAAKFLARKQSKKLLIVGAGNVARELAFAYAEVFELSTIEVWNITYERAVNLANELQAKGFSAVAVKDLKEAVSRSDIVSCATLSTDALIRREWVKKGTHIDLIGSFKPNMRETDDAMFADTCVFVDTSEALDKAGDLLSPMAAGVLNRDEVKADLEALCQGKHQGRLHDEEITVYKAVGTAMEDLAAAILVYENSTS
ncbi:ornithine cyclodeaminase family protein [Psychrobacter sp. I-STPA10]|uniref:ornithine cyclodeaminase family protein n=1 Tax=Psychrobacter sp. I-STPA10 TaxID=2585769 RepID=UPI001E5ADCE4|nr:ornithine cyclodeaminase family protein [Psychrobacter sp. I-STPA10]